MWDKGLILSMESLVSIIVPVFNVEKYLEECIESIIHQSYQNLEIILVDDGSTDQSGKICDRFSKTDTRIKVVHSRNNGASAARNYGFSIAQGDYIYTCDSDDYIACDTVEKLVSIMEEKGCDYVFFNGYTISDDNTVIKEAYIRKGDYPDSTGEETAHRLLVNDEYKPGTPLAFYKKEFLDSNGIRFYEGIMCEDELFSFYTYNKSKVVAYCKEPFYYRRIRGDSVMASSTNTERKFLGCSTVFFQMLAYCDESSRFSRTNQEFLIRMGKSSMLAFRQLAVGEKEKNREIYGRIKRQVLRHVGFGDISLVVRIYCWNLGVLMSGLRKYWFMRKYGT